MHYLWLFLLVLCGLGWLIVRWRDRLERELIYLPERELLFTPASEGLTARDVWLLTEDKVRLHAWWFPCENARGTLLLCHGNKGNISGRLWVAHDFLAWGMNVMLFDYRGYGMSEGIPSAQGTRLDVQAAYTEALRRSTDCGGRILVLGRSLGGAVACQLAADHHITALILESTFTSTLEMGRRFHAWMLPRLTLRNRYDSLSVVPSLTMPKIIAHAREDARIPFDMAETLFHAAGEPKQFIELQGAHHLSSWRTSPTYHTAIVRLLDEVFTPRPSS